MMKNPDEIKRPINLIHKLLKNLHGKNTISKVKK